MIFLKYFYDNRCQNVDEFLSQLCTILLIVLTTDCFTETFRISAMALLSAPYSGAEGGGGIGIGTEELQSSSITEVERNFGSRTVTCIPAGYILCYYNLYEVNRIERKRKCTPTIHGTKRDDRCFENLCKWSNCQEALDAPIDDDLTNDGKNAV